MLQQLWAPFVNIIVHNLQRMELNWKYKTGGEGKLQWYYTILNINILIKVAMLLNGNGVCSSTHITSTTFFCHPLTTCPELNRQNITGSCHTNRTVIQKLVEVRMWIYILQMMLFDIFKFESHLHTIWKIFHTLHLHTVTCFTLNLSPNGNILSNKDFEKLLLSHVLWHLLKTYFLWIPRCQVTEGLT